MARKLVVYGSCQVAALHRLLAEDYPDAFEYECVEGYHYYRTGRPLPDSMWDADVFIYQPLKNSRGLEARRGYETAPMVESFKESGTQCFSFPLLHFEGYHPDFCLDPLGTAARHPENGESLFPYGMEGVMTLRGMMPVPEIVERTRADDFLSTDYIDYQREKSLDVLRRNELECDVAVADWIVENFRETPLFHTVNHPSNAMIQRVYHAVLDYLGLPGVDISGRPELLDSHRPPLYPCVREAMGFGFDFAPVHFWEGLSYEEYIGRYASLKVNDTTCSARLVCGDFPRAMKAGGAYEVEVALHNESSCTWHAPGGGSPEVKLSYHWFRRWETYQWDNVRTPLFRTLEPGEVAETSARIDAPQDPGSFELVWDLVIEGVAWFSSRGCYLPRHRVEVAP